MKYFIMSDIHGSASACERALNQFEKMKCNAIILLGDVLYHGPRNPLPDAYDPKAVIEMLNPFAGKIFACRGNCDSEVDQMVLKFPMLSDYTYVVDDGMRIFASHGHIYSPAEEEKGTPVVAGSKIPQLTGTTVELFGHIHVQHLYRNNAGITVCNPGSVSLPKNDSPAGFAVYEDRAITLYDMNGKEQKKLAV